MCPLRSSRAATSSAMVRLSSALRSMACWKTTIERASAPTSSCRFAWGIVTPVAPPATSSVTRVMSRSGRATARPMIAMPATARSTHTIAMAARNHAVSRHAGIQLGIDLLGARVVDPRQCVEILVQRRAHAAVGFVVAPLASLRRAHFRAEPDQLLAKLHELLRCACRIPRTARRRRCPHACASRQRRSRCARWTCSSSVAIALGGRNVGRHVDAARFHDHRVDQAVDALDIHRAHERAFELVGQRRVVARVERRQHGQRPRSRSRAAQRSYRAWPRSKGWAISWTWHPGSSGASNWR